MPERKVRTCVGRSAAPAASVGPGSVCNSVARRLSRCDWLTVLAATACSRCRCRACSAASAAARSISFSNIRFFSKNFFCTCAGRDADECARSVSQRAGGGRAQGYVRDTAGQSDQPTRATGRRQAVVARRTCRLESSVPPRPIRKVITRVSASQLQAPVHGPLEARRWRAPGRPGAYRRRCRRAFARQGG